ncbi:MULTISPECIES: hypothetical protein [Streptomyces]|uniref:Uncharacterized protein n=1 Tax=Streptomyces tricolor TaxID=68277 RepID=A0ABS9JD28_9ACTN|nr:hypothetical protein [Streptomyces tricolor]MCG0063458.1 hypothetical protein [Streptomyces tricolor]
MRQQVADQQHTMEGLAEVNAVARDAMARTDETVSGPLATIGSELAAVRGAVARLDDRLTTRFAGPQSASDTANPPEPTPEPAPQAEPRPTGPEPQREAGGGIADAGEPDASVLRAAAGVAHATLEAHRDTWAFLIQVAGNEQHFHIPGKVEDRDGFVSVRFSGPSLVAALTSLTHVIGTTGNPVTRAIADHIRLKIIASVQAITGNPGRDGDGTPLRIVIDDRAAPEQPEQPEPSEER